MVIRRKDESQPDGKGRIKFRYTDAERTLDFSMENVASDSVTEGLRSIANALAGRPIAADPTRRLPKTANGAPAKTVDEDVTLVVPEEDDAPAEVAEVADDEAESDNQAERRRRPAPRAPKFLSELNLTTAKVLLPDFINEKSPDGDMDKYAVIAAWYKEHFSTDEISVDHIFTAYKTLGWQAQMPPDPSQTLRNLKSNKNWFDGGSKRGFFKINWNGMDAVNKMGVASA